jgi:hypothetical protein
VGVPLDDTPDPGGLSGAGSATAFDRFQDWGVRGLLTAGSTAGNFEFFGTSVAMAEGLPAAGRPVPFAVVGAPRDSTGEAYVFEADRFDPGGNPAVSPWRSVGRLPRSNPSRAFGTSVAADQRLIVVGAPEEPPSFAGEGAVHIFARSFTPLGWSEQRFRIGPEGATSFGQSVGVSAFGPGSAANALVGSPLAGGFSSTGVFQPQRGFAWVLNRSGSPPSWSAPTIIEANDGDATDRFGSSVDVSGGTAVIGAPNDNTFTGVDTGTDTGSAYVVAVP